MEATERHIASDIECCDECARTENSAKGDRTWNLALVRVGLGIAGILFLEIFRVGFPVRVAVATAILCFLGATPFFRGIRGLVKGFEFDENLLMSLAGVGAFILGDYPESLAVLVFYWIGWCFETRAVARSTAAIESLIDKRPISITVEEGERLVPLAPELVSIGQVYRLGPGEQAALDGVIVRGKGDVDMSSLNGEAIPQIFGPGDRILSGSINGHSVLSVRVDTPFENSTLSRILALVTDASARKATSETLIRRFAKIYTPSVFIAAILIGFLPPLVFHAGTLVDWLQRALVFLVVSCPCALVISVPLAYFAGLGGAASVGLLIKGSHFLDALARMDAIVFDKTGTLSTGHMRVISIVPEGEADRILALAAGLEASSTHPLARALSARYVQSSQTVPPSEFSEIEELAGLGMRGLSKSGTQVLVGKRELLIENGVEIPRDLEGDSIEDAGNLRVFVSDGGRLVGTVVLDDEKRPEAAVLIADLKGLGVGRMAIFSGDRQERAEKLGASLGIGEVHGDLLPADKVAYFEKMHRGGRTGFVGDGVNDAALLARADVGIAMGQISSDAAIAAADVVLMGSDLRGISEGIRRARHAKAVAVQNIVFSLGAKLIFLGLGALGLAGLWFAVAGDTGVTVLAVLNSLRARGRRAKTPAEGSKSTASSEVVLT